MQPKVGRVGELTISPIFGTQPLLYLQKGAESQTDHPSATGPSFGPHCDSSREYEPATRLAVNRRLPKPIFAAISSVHPLIESHCLN